MSKKTSNLGGNAKGCITLVILVVLSITGACLWLYLFQLAPTNGIRLVSLVAIGGSLLILHHITRIMERSFFPGKERDQISLRFLRWRCFPVLVYLAERFCHLGLRIFHRSISPSEWASYQVLLAQILLAKQFGNQAQNLEDAISHVDQALEVYTPDGYPYKWAETLNLLGVFYLFRIRGDRAENVEKARECFEHALKVISPATNPGSYAALLNGLGAVYAKRVRGKREENLEQAVTLYTQASEQFADIQDTSTWHFSQRLIISQNHWSLANAYVERVEGDKTENIEQALVHYHHALTDITRDNRPVLWSKLIADLGYAYLLRIRGEKADNLEQTIAYCQDALTIQEVTKQNLPTQWATVINTLADAYAERIQGNTENNLQQAIAYYQQALEVRTPEYIPAECRKTANALGCLYYNRHHFAEARRAFEIAHHAVQYIRQDVQRDQAKRQLSAQNADLYAQLVSCCLDMAQQNEASYQEHIYAAFVYTTVAKGRAFVDGLVSGSFDLLRIGTDDPALVQALHALRELRQQIDNLRLQLSGNHSPVMMLSSLITPATPANTALDAELHQLQTQEATLWEELSFKYPRLTATQQAPSLSVTDAQHLSQAIDATLVEYYRHAQGWCAFVVTPDGVSYVPLPLISKELLETTKNWLQIMNPVNPVNPKDTHLRTSPQLMRKPLLDWHAAVITPLREFLPTGSRIVLSPHGVLSLFPFNAARDPQTGHYASDDYQLAFVPSLSALWVMYQQATQLHSTAHSSQNDKQATQSFLNVAYVHTPDHPRHIPGAVDANRTLAQTFAPHVTGLYDDDATLDAIIAATRQQPPPAIIHITAHGGFESELPEQSGLELAGGYLTVQHIISELSLQQTQLVTLASCLLGQASVEQSGENVGITQAFLTSGASVVVTALWEVDAPATLALFEAFYRRIIAGDSPAGALREATAELRAIPKWVHPYYWAAWQVYGLGF